MKKFFFALLLLVVTMVPNGTGAFTVSPARGVITIEPGSSERVTISITNTENEPGLYRLSGVGLGQDSRGHTIRLETSEQADWVRSEPEEILIPAGHTVPAVFIISIPPGTRPGTRPVGLVVQHRAAHVPGTAINSEIAVTLAVQVAGEVTESLAFRRLQLPQVLFGNQLPLDFELENQGTIEVPVTVALELNDVFTPPKRATIPINGSVLPGAVRSVRQEILLNDEIRLWPGPIQVALQAKYGKTSQTVFSYTTLWYFPWWSPISAGSILSILSVFVFFIFKRKRHR